MPFKPGCPGGPGRKPGVKLANTREVMMQIVATYGDPLVGLAEIASTEGNEMALRVQAYKELAKYAHAQRKAEDDAGESADRLIIELDMPRRAGLLHGRT